MAQTAAGPTRLAEASAARGDAPSGGRAAAVGSVALFALPAALTIWLSFHSGGFFVGAQAVAALVVCAALLLRITMARMPAAGLTGWGLVSLAGLGGLGAWMLISSGWSDASARALMEFNRVLLYVLTFGLFASLTGSADAVRWVLRLTALAFSVVSLVALGSRLLPELVGAPAVEYSTRLSWPLEYWNALGLMAGMGIVLCVHLSASLTERPAVRIAAASLIPALAVTTYLTLSRGGILASTVGLLVLLLVGRSRGLASALLAAAPATALAVTVAYRSEELLEPLPVTQAFLDDGRRVALVVGACTLGAALLRTLGLVLDRRLLRLNLRIPGPRWAHHAVPIAVAIALVGVGLAAGGAGELQHQWDRATRLGFFGAPEDVRDRLLDPGANGRIEIWQAAWEGFQSEPLRGEGAGTYARVWAQERPIAVAVQDGHSVYLETMAELGVVGLLLLLVGLGVPVVAIIRRRAEDRVLWSGVLAVSAAWLLRAGLDWDWEMPAITLWFFAMAGLACAARSCHAPSATGGDMRLRRVVAALGLLAVAITPAKIAMSQMHLDRALTAFARNDCAAVVDEALASLDAVRQRPEPLELLGYCDVRSGRPDLGVRVLEGAVRRDRGDWQLHYGLALVRAANRMDPRLQLRRALALNPREPLLREQVPRFQTNKPAVWRRAAAAAPLVVPIRERARQRR